MVGDDETAQTFTVHEHILRTNRFFDKALKKGWKETEDARIKLPDQDPLAFEVFLFWQSSHRFHVTRAEEIIYAIGSISGVLIHAYILGDALMDGDFADAVLDAFIDWALASNNTNLRHLEMIWQHTTVGDGLRRLLIDRCVWKHGERCLSEKYPHYTNAEILREVIRALNRRVKQGKVGPGSKAPYILDRCQYHRHESRVCYRVTYYLPRNNQTPAVPNYEHPARANEEGSRKRLKR